MLKRDVYAKGLCMLGDMSPFVADVPKNTVDLWYRLLSDMPDELFSAAVFDICRNKEIHKFTNVVHMVRESALDIMRQSLPTAEHAWGEVITQVRRVGSGGAPSFSNPLITSLVDRIGWQSFCDMPHGDGVLRGQFLRLYEASVSKKMRDGSLYVGSESEAAQLLERLGGGFQLFGKKQAKAIGGEVD